MLRTNEFEIIEKQIIVFSSVNGTRRIDFDEVKQLEITIGSLVKYPAKSMVFGLCIISLTLVILFYLDYQTKTYPWFLGIDRGTAAMLVMLLFM